MDLNPNNLSGGPVPLCIVFPTNEDTERSLGNVSIFHTFMLIRIDNSLPFGAVASSTLGSSSLTRFEQKFLVPKLSESGLIIFENEINVLHIHSHV